MNKVQIENKLNELFKNHRIIFWNDSESEFSELILDLDINEVGILFPDDIGQFKTKCLIEIENPRQKYLIYSAKSEPKLEDDWLLDIRLYSYQFRADRSSLIVAELGLREHYLRDHIKKRSVFFASKERFSKLKNFIKPDDLAKTIDREMIAVCAGSDTYTMNDIVCALFCSMSKEGGLDTIPSGWKNIEKFELKNIFWELICETFNYRSDNPTLRDFLTYLFVTDLSVALHSDCPASLKQFCIEPGSNAVVLLNAWRDSQKKMESYDKLSEELSEVLDVEHHIEGLTIEDLQDVQTFFVIEKICAIRLKEKIIQATSNDQLDKVVNCAKKRCDMHWANRNISSDYINREAFASVYTAIEYMAEFLSLKYSKSQGFSSPSHKDIFHNYTKEYYLFDQLYRLFHEHAAIAAQKGWDILKELGNQMDDMYENWFLTGLSLEWEKHVSLADWKIEGIENQYSFYETYPEPAMGEKRSTAFVVISDAFRYEAAEELKTNLNSRYRFSAELKSMLGVLPSYTDLGMASLLPHTELTYDSKGRVLVDGELSNSLEQRNNLLKKVKGVAIKAEDFISMNRTEAREFICDKQIIYVFHNKIDAIGDVAKTERGTFDAVRDSIRELENIVSFAINSLQAKYVFVTADHGFIYNRKNPDDVDKYKVSDTIDKKTIIKMNKRFILGSYIPIHQEALQGICSNTAGVLKEKDMPFMIPRGLSRFYFTGGARFVHGGMSLQEVVIPVIAVTQLRGRAKEKTREGVVGIQILGAQHRITTEKYRVHFLQLDSVSERVKALSVKVGIYDDESLISDIKTVTFDSQSNDISERDKEAVLTLKNQIYDPEKSYRLIVRDIKTNIEVNAVNVKIDRAFTSDF
jgi:uncharacterized protein (TIGR02687 family)